MNADYAFEVPLVVVRITVAGTPYSKIVAWLKDYGFSGATIYEATGYHNGSTEAVKIIEIGVMDSKRMTVDAVRRLLQDHHQDSAYMTFGAVGGLVYASSKLGEDEDEV